MNYQINILEMKRKTEIEDKLLFDINKNFQEHLTDIEYIKTNFIQIINENNLGSKKYFNIQIFPQSSNIEIKLFEYPNTIYSIFQCFYSKRKNYMGMNLTGLIQGKMETGLGFRSSIIKINLSDIKDDELFNIVNQQILKLEPKLESESKNINVYKINSNGFGWKDWGIENFRYVYLVADLTNKKYFFILEK